MHADISDPSPDANQFRAHCERRRHTHSLHNNIKPINIAKMLLRGLSRLSGIITRNSVRPTSLLRDFQPLLVLVEENDLRRRVQRRADSRRETYRTGADDGDAASWLDVAAKRADLEAGGQNVAVDEEAALVDAWRDVV